MPFEAVYTKDVSKVYKKWLKYMLCIHRSNPFIKKSGIGPNSREYKNTKFRPAVLGNR